MGDFKHFGRIWEDRQLRHIANVFIRLDDG